MPKWNPDLYMKFGNERTQPSIDLVARILLNTPATIIDLGCGAGNSTEVLRNRWPNAKISGLDSSEEMISQAREKYSEIEWITENIATWKPKVTYDIIFSNAALQWVPNHRELFCNILEYLNNSGFLAVQVPYHYDSQLHQIITEISYHSQWTELLHTARNALTSHPPKFYYDLLHSRCKRIDIWQTDYHHTVENPAAILEWISGTGLRPYLEALQTEKDRDRFKEMVLQRCEKSYPSREDGKVLFPFRRLFLLINK